MKIALIIDKSRPYLDFQRDKILSDWKIDEYELVKSFSEVGEATIFGIPPTSEMFIEDTNGIKKLLNDLEQASSNGTLNSRLEQGLVVKTTVARVSTKKLESFIKDNGGIVVFAKENAKDKTKVSDKMLSQTGLNNKVKDFLSDYIGDDYETLITILRSIDVLSHKQQYALQVDDMFIRLPQPPGAIPPWEIEKPIMAGDANKTIEMYRRITQHSHYLVIVSILKNKLQLAWKIASLMSVQPNMSMANLANALNTPNNYPFKLSYNTAKDFGQKNLESCLKILLEAESNVKGNSNADGNVIIEIALMNIVSKLRR